MKSKTLIGRLTEKVCVFEENKIDMFLSDHFDAPENFSNMFRKIFRMIHSSLFRKSRNSEQQNN